MIGVVFCMPVIAWMVARRFFLGIERDLDAAWREEVERLKSKHAASVESLKSELENCKGLLEKANAIARECPRELTELRQRHCEALETLQKRVEYSKTLAKKLDEQTAEHRKLVARAEAATRKLNRIDDVLHDEVSE